MLYRVVICKHEVTLQFTDHNPRLSTTWSDTSQLIVQIINPRLSTTWSDTTVWSDHNSRLSQHVVDSLGLYWSQPLTINNMKWHNSFRSQPETIKTWSDTSVYRSQPETINNMKWHFSLQITTRDYQNMKWHNSLQITTRDYQNMKWHFSLQITTRDYQQHEVTLQFTDHNPRLSKHEVTLQFTDHNPRLSTTWSDTWVYRSQLEVCDHVNACVTSCCW